MNQLLNTSPTILVSGGSNLSTDVELVERGDILEVLVRSSRGSLASITLTWDRKFPDNSLCFLDAWERGYGDLGWYSLDPERRLPWFTAVSSNEGVFGFGVQTGGSAFAHWQIGADKVHLHLDLRAGSQNCVLGGRTLSAAKIDQLYGESSVDVHRFMHRLAQRLCPNPKLPELPVFGANDWYYAYGNNTADQILKDSERTSLWALDSVNRPFSVIDAGWQPKGGCEGGPWNDGNDRFGNMQSLADQIAQTGCKPGIWIRPLLTTEAVSESRTLFSNTLDPSIPENLVHISQDIARCRDWGYRLIKHDFTSWDCTGQWGFEMESNLFAAGRSFQDDTRTGAETIVRLYETIREAAGDAILIGCNTFGHLAAGTHEVQRTGDDTSGKEWARTKKMGVNTLAFRSFQHNAFFAADADCVGITPQIDWRLNRQWLDVVAKSGTPLFVSADFQSIGPEQDAALRETFQFAAIQQEVSIPVDWYESATPRQWQQNNLLRSYDWD